ncbi:MAG TPA: LysM peptidoglycan-binding domain-containing protein [Terracidiphilus sp.]|nr:LysM peptidoglycan-binding domain-containing protein [Terracidiphilus sp.]
MYTGSDLAAWWEKNRRESDKALDDFVDAYPHLWVLAAVTGTAMDVGAGTVDLLRFGEGAAESYETGKIAPLLQDLLRGASIAAEVGGLAKGARPLLGKLKLYSDPGGGICVPMSIGNALRRTGQRFLLSLQEIGEASGLSFAQIWNRGLTDPQMLATLRRLGVRFETIARAQNWENLVNIAKRSDGVVSLPLSSGIGGHMALLERAGNRVRIVDRTGFFNSLAELSQRYGTTFTVDGAGTAVVVKNVTARILNGVATLMLYTNGIVVKLDGNMTTTALDAKFNAFQQSRKSTPPTGAPGNTVIVARGDSLSGLAAKYYGTAEYWPLLWDMNRNLVGPNPNRIPPGMRLNVPPLSSFTQAQLADARRRFPTWRNY